MKKKTLAILLTAAMAASVFAGCGAKQEETPAEETKTEEKAAETTETKTEEKKEEKKEEVSSVNKGQEYNGTFTANVDMSSYEKGKIVRLWLPCPQDNDYQTITNEKVELDTAHAKSETTTDALGNKILYVEWDAEATDRKVSYTFTAQRYERLIPTTLAENADAPDASVSEYLKASSTLPVDGEVKALAEQITSGKKTNLEKARAIYDWVIANMNRDDSVVGCGLGNVPELLTTLKGKCTDINSVFVALCRAAGIPAREYFGIRMSGDAEADMTGGQHCWAEFYLQGTGWVAADPADVLKAVLKNNWAKDSAECKEKIEYFWGGYDGQRVALSTGRDLILSPKQDGAALNNFGYPYAEVDGKNISCYAPKDFAYSYSFKKN